MGWGLGTPRSFQRHGWEGLTNTPLEQTSVWFLCTLLPRA